MKFLLYMLLFFIIPTAWAEQEDKHLTLSFSPLHLLFPMVEGSAEIKLNDSLGLAFIGGFGVASSDVVTDYNVTEFGIQLNYYRNRQFTQGLHFGVEALAVVVEDAEQAQITGRGEALGIGPYIGYKTMNKSGLVVIGQLGFQYYRILAEVSDDTLTLTGTDSGAATMLNLNIGWNL